ncbi:hypothetical protein [Metabacillus niabensis]|uniref:hypothetical protein n=1 Tax=Metabacillus niabensis TaxID=324854 RepID=UPI001CF9A045|nr:hypothetical protein [Metabacillus niabensis]
MRKLIFCFLLLLVLLTGYNIFNRAPHNVELGNSIYSIVEDVNNTEISINTLADFDWDKGFLFTLYSTQNYLYTEFLWTKKTVPQDNMDPIRIKDINMAYLFHIVSYFNNA